MVERIDDTALTAVLHAAADPTRRAILTRLAQQGPTRVTDLAARFDISLNAVSKHIRVLEDAGLVSREIRWRDHFIRAELHRAALIADWFAGLRPLWDQRLESLDTILTTETDHD